MNPSWHGASQDVADMESESILKQQAAERKEIEDAQRREAAARKAEEEERRRTEGNVTRGLRGPRGRGRGSGRGITRASPGYSGVGGQGGRGGIGRSSSIGQTRAGSGIGRGIPGARARGRGVP